MIRILICCLLAGGSGAGNLFGQGAVPMYGNFPNLSRLLELTAEQQQLWAVRFAEWQTHQSEKLQRLSTVQQEIREERLKPSPSASELGLRYYEVAAICQEGLSRQGQLKAGLREVLSAAQRQKLDGLESRKIDLARFEEALQLRLIDARVDDGLGAPSSMVLGWAAFRIEVAPTAVGCSDRAVAAAFMRLPDLAENPFLTGYLGFDARQIDLLRALLRQRAENAEELTRESLLLAGELRSAATAPNPQAEVLGAKVARMEQICRELLVVHRAYATAFAQLLTTEEQKQRWQAIQKAIELLPSLYNAQLSDLLPHTFTEASRPAQWRVWQTPVSNLEACNVPAATGGVFVGGN